jgi:hypothetical protein
MRSDRASRWIDGAIVVGLCLLVFLAFWQIGPAGRVLAEGDLFTYFYPYWSEATRALRTGRLPLWNDVLFMGVPFLANSQIGMFYPPNWPLWLLLPAHRSLHWSILIHLSLAAVGTYIYSRRSLGLGQLGAGVAGAALALGGYLGAQVEHINQLQALAWFPWLLLLVDRALERRRWAWIGLVLVVGLILLAGHTQSAFIVLVGLGIYVLVPGGPVPRLRRLAMLVAVGALGVALAAVQLVPTFELTRLSVRAQGLPFNERVSFSLSPLYLARALLPGYGRPVAPERIEYVATIGLIGLALAALGGWTLLRRGDRDRSHIGILLLAGLGLFLALGLYNPVYLLLARFVPGFAHFRVPARWLALWAFSGTLLAGVGIERLVQGGLRFERQTWSVAGAGTAVLLLWGALGGQVAVVTPVIWIVTIVLTTALVWFVHRSGSSRGRRLAALGLVALLVAELLVSARTLPHTRATAPDAYTGLRPAAAHLLAASEGEEPPGRFLSLSALVFDPGDLAELRLIYGAQLSEEALYNLIVSAKQREVLSPNLPLALDVPAVDGFGGGLLPLARYLALQRVLYPVDQVSLDGRLRENLTQVPDGRWLSLFDVRYVITDKVFDAWIDGVFYDLQFGADLAAGETAAVAHMPTFDATALGLVSYLEGAAALPDGIAVGEVEVGFADGTTRTFPLRAGIETAEGLPTDEVVHGPAAVGGHFWVGQPEGTDYVTRLRWDGAAVPSSVVVRGALPQGQLVVRGVSLIDERTESFQSLVLSDRGRFRLAHSGDVKVYQNLDALGRAFVVHRAWAVDGEAGAQERMAAGGFDPTTEVVLEGGEPLAVEAGGPDQVEVVSYTPERVELAVALDAPGVLVLADANYPGWQAWVDGEEVPVMTADLLFRAVSLEPGRHQVVFAFEPRSVRWGIWTSLASVVALLSIGLVIAARARRKPTGGVREESPTERPKQSPQRDQEIASPRLIGHTLLSEEKKS